MGPTMPLIWGSANNLVNASTVPGLELWLSSMRSSTARPRMPPLFLMSSSASCSPLTSKVPHSAYGPVNVLTTPILMVSAAYALAASNNDMHSTIALRIGMGIPPPDVLPVLVDLMILKTHPSQHNRCRGSNVLRYHSIPALA